MEEPPYNVGDVMNRTLANVHATTGTETFRYVRNTTLPDFEACYELLASRDFDIVMRSKLRESIDHVYSMLDVGQRSDLLAAVRLMLMDYELCMSLAVRTLMSQLASSSALGGAAREPAPPNAILQEIDQLIKHIQDNDKECGIDIGKLAACAESLRVAIDIGDEKQIELEMMRVDAALAEAENMLLGMKATKKKDVE